MVGANILFNFWSGNWGCGNSGQPIFFWCCAAFAGGFALFAYGFILRSRRKLIENIPTSKVRSMAVGLVELQGAAREFGKPLVSPFSGESCVHYEYHVEELRSSGRNRYWATVVKYKSSECFYLEDETGKVLVNPKGADLRLAVDRRYSTELFSSRDAGIFLAGLDRLGISTTSFGFRRTLRGKEIYVQPGDKIYALGTALPLPAILGGPTEQNPLWIEKGAGNYYCISDKSEKELLASMLWTMILALYGGPALTLASGYFLMKYYLWPT
jgi:hypothetical protein